MATRCCCTRVCGCDSSPPEPYHRATPTINARTVRCTHRSAIKRVVPDSDGCAECLAIGDEWVHLRMCMSCGAIGVAGNQGISHGWSDTYRFFLGGQYFVLDGGDGQDPVPPGDYLLRITVNPPFAAKKGEACPYVDTHGLCHQLPESNYDNNVGVAMVSVPDHPGRDGVGPLKDQKALGYEPIDHQ